ncbi:hypothetical protein MRX96_001209 [Rhipicephalus microplus]
MWTKAIRIHHYFVVQKTCGEKLDQKETNGSDVPATKLPEQTGEPVDAKATNRALEKLDSQEAVTADGFSVKLPGQPADSTPNKAQIFTEFLEKLHSTRVVSGASRQHEFPCTRRCWAVAVILVIVVTGVVIFLPLMWSRDVCETPVCRHYAMLLDDTISSTLPPCIDFHAHVCAGWERSHRISVIDNVYEHFIDRVAEKVSTTTSPQKGQTAVQKAAALFRSCRSIYTGRRSELELVKMRLLDFGVFWPEMTNKSSILRILFSMAAAWNWGSFIHISLWQPGRLTVAPALYFNQTLKRRQVMLKDGNSYQKYFNKMVAAFGRDEGQVPSYEELIELESTVLRAVTKPYNAVPWNKMKNAGLGGNDGVSDGKLSE